MTGPELLSDTYLSLFLAQLQTDKYSIFVVIGNLPDSEADKVLSVTPLSPQQFRRAATSSSNEYEDDDQLNVKFVLCFRLSFFVVKFFPEVYGSERLYRIIKGFLLNISDDTLSH